MTLPPPDVDAEDDFVARWRDEAGSVGELVDAISAALAARRPHLAARLVGLLDDDVELPDPAPLVRARAAARMLLLARPSVDTALLQDAWADVTSRLAARARARMRARYPLHPPRGPHKRRR